MPGGGGVRTERRPAGGQLAAGLLAAALALPILLLAGLSAARAWEFPGLLPRGWSLDAWRDTLTGGATLGRSLLLSAALSLAVALAATVCGALAGRFVAARAHPERLRSIALLPFTASPIVLGVCLLWVFLKLDLTGTILGVGLAQMALAASFATVFFSDFWSGPLRDLEGAARTLGAGPADLYRRILWPLSRRALALCFLQAFLLSWFQYALTWLIGGGKVATLTVRVFDFLGEANLRYAATAALVLMLPALAALWLMRRLEVADRCS